MKESPAPKFDLDAEYEVQKTITKLIRAGVIESAHDVSDGGLFIALLESAFTNNLGFVVVMIFLEPHLKPLEDYHSIF